MRLDYQMARPILMGVVCGALMIWVLWRARTGTISIRGRPLERTARPKTYWAMVVSASVTLVLALGLVTLGVLGLLGVHGSA